MLNTLSLNNFSIHDKKGIFPFSVISMPRRGLGPGEVCGEFKRKARSNSIFAVGPPGSLN